MKYSMHEPQYPVTSTILSAGQYTRQQENNILELQTITKIKIASYVLWAP